MIFIKRNGMEIFNMMISVFRRPDLFDAIQIQQHILDPEKGHRLKYIILEDEEIANLRAFLNDMLKPPKDKPAYHPVRLTDPNQLIERCKMRLENE